MFNESAGTDGRHGLGVQRKAVSVKGEKQGYSESFSSRPVLLALRKAAFTAKTSMTR
jgi:hypothetical protein